MAKARQEQYGNTSIVSLKGEDRVRKRPSVIFGSDDLEGCKHAVFEILSNAIDEAREGHGDTVIVTRYEDRSIEIEDFGRGCPVDYNEKEKRYNWELAEQCEIIILEEDIWASQWKPAQSPVLLSRSLALAAAAVMLSIAWSIPALRA